MTGETVIDATGMILGRLASVVAKRLLSGERIVIVNAEKAVISGKRRSVIRRYKEFLEIGRGGGTARKGPIHYRRPDRLLRRTVRGMLPWKKPRGRQAYRRLRVYIGVPREYEGREFERIPEADASKLRCSYVTLGEVAREIGWKPPEEV